MCKAIMRQAIELRQKTLAGRLEDKIEEDYGIRPYGVKMHKKALGMDTRNKFYQPGGRGYVEDVEAPRDRTVTHARSIAARRATGG